MTGRADHSSTTTAMLATDLFVVGDNLDLLSAVPDETIHLIYLDPPFNTGRDFHYFRDVFADFPAFLAPRLTQCHRVLRHDGNLVVHVDPTIAHHVRALCDSIFGDKNFKNEIVWVTGGNAKNLHKLGRNHDTLIVYGKQKNSQFFPMYTPYTETYMRSLKTCPATGRAYSTTACHNAQPEVNPRPNLTYEWNGHVRQWYVSRARMEQLDADNRLEYNARGIPRIKRYADELQGVPVRDTWTDIPTIQAAEKSRYATQKPVKLLERVVQLYSAENDVCLDPFAGTGTLGRACARLNRRYILFDINPEARDIFQNSL
jgi:DNA modification methylase